MGEINVSDLNRIGRNPGYIQEDVDLPPPPPADSLTISPSAAMQGSNYDTPASSRVNFCARRTTVSVSQHYSNDQYRDPTCTASSKARARRALILTGWAVTILLGTVALIVAFDAGKSDRKQRCDCPAAEFGEP